MTFNCFNVGRRPFHFRSTDEAAVHPEKFRGLQRFGPYRPLDLPGGPRLGFVFPTEYREDANRLYMALKHGVAYFKGAESLLHMPISRDRVFAITGFSLDKSGDPHIDAASYRDAIGAWMATGNRDVDLFLVLHRKSPVWEEDTPYYACKAALLSQGWLSQHVTVDLLRNPAQFEWSAAEIALQMFVKLGGVPWVLNREVSARGVVIGVGRSETIEKGTGRRTRSIGFTACIHSNGPYLFSALGRVATSTEEYLSSLRAVVTDTLVRVATEHPEVNEISLHMPKEFGRDDGKAVDLGVDDAKSRVDCSRFRLSVCKVTAEEEFFLLNEAGSGSPAVSRGTCVAIGEDTYLVCTEGSEELRAWEGRDPTIVRVRTYGEQARLHRSSLIEQVFDLSQVNYRGFRSSSEPISIKYSRLMTRLLSHLAPNDAERFVATGGQRELDRRVWFL